MSGISCGVGPLARVAGQHAGHVAQDHQELRLRHSGHQRGEHIIVAHADLFDRDGVVLVHDRDHAGFEQALDGMDALLRRARSARYLMSEQELRDRAPDGAEGPRPIRPSAQFGLLPRPPGAPPSLRRRA